MRRVPQGYALALGPDGLALLPRQCPVCRCLYVPESESQEGCGKCMAKVSDQYRSCEMVLSDGRVCGKKFLPTSNRQLYCAQHSEKQSRRVRKIQPTEVPFETAVEWVAREMVARGCTRLEIRLDNDRAPQVVFLDRECMG